MKKLVTLFLSILFFTTLVKAQIYAPQGLNMPGSYDSFTDPPTISAFAGIQKSGGTLLVITQGTRRYHTVINCQSSGGDVIAGTYQFIFTSGPPSNYFQNTWKDVTVSMNTIQSYNYNGASNDNVTLTNGNYYVVNWLDNGYANTSAIWMQISAAPVTIPTVTDNIPSAISGSTDATVNITLSASKSPEENVFLRYSNDSFTTWTTVQASGSGTAYTATIPNGALQGTAPTHAYYVFTSTLSLTTLTTAPYSTSGADIDAATINFNNNGGSNYSLPVELTTFTAELNASIVNLKWQTATEVNNYGFEVQRAISNQQSANLNWEKIGFVKGSGNSNSVKQYSYADNSVLAGNYSYRLKQIDNNGQYKYSSVVEINAAQMPNGILLNQNYPNPFNPSTQIQFGVSKNTTATLIIYNILGEKVSTLFNGNAVAGQVYNISFNGDKLASGIYYYKLQTNDKTEVKKMLLMK